LAPMTAMPPVRGRRRRNPRSWPGVYFGVGKMQLAKGWGGPEGLGNAWQNRCRDFLPLKTGLVVTVAVKPNRGGTPRSKNRRFGRATGIWTQFPGNNRTRRFAVGGQRGGHPPVWARWGTNGAPGSRGPIPEWDWKLVRSWAFCSRGRGENAGLLIDHEKLIAPVVAGAILGGPAERIARVGHWTRRGPRKKRWGDPHQGADWRGPAVARGRTQTRKEVWVISGVRSGGFLA